MNIQPMKLSDFDSTDDFINALIDVSQRPEGIRYYMDEDDIERMKRVMELSDEIMELIKDSKLSVWTFSDFRGTVHVAFAWMGNFCSEVNMKDEGEGWVEVPITREDVERLWKEHTAERT